MDALGEKLHTPTNGFLRVPVANVTRERDADRTGGISARVKVGRRTWAGKDFQGAGVE